MIGLVFGLGNFGWTWLRMHDLECDSGFLTMGNIAVEVEMCEMEYEKLKRIRINFYEVRMIRGLRIRIKTLIKS